MIEIIVLIFLCRSIGHKALQKGLKASWWKFYTVMGWISGEVIGMIIAIIMFGPKNTFSIYSIAIGGAFGGYLFIKYLIEKAPDKSSDLLDGFGEDVQK